MRKPIKPEGISQEESHLSTVPHFCERHYSVAELAGRWNLSPDTIRRFFENEPGVLVISGDEPRYGRRRYTTLRIPESVALRVHRRLAKV